VPKLLPASELATEQANGQAVVDLRPAAAYAEGHLPGTLSIPATHRSFSTYVGWFADYDRPLYFITPSLAEAAGIITALQSIGIDHIPGYFAPDALREARSQLPMISAAALAERLPLNDLLVLDVRGRNEFASGHIHGAQNIPLGHLPQRLAELPRNRTIVTQCATGYRSHIAASWLRAHGYGDVMSLNDNLEQWSQRVPVVKEPENHEFLLVRR
jgi:hydroxyacylglutathione hydrolase